MTSTLAESREERIAKMAKALYPAAAEGRSLALRKSLARLSEVQFETAEQAVRVGLERQRPRLVADLIETGDVLSLEATARWGRVLRVWDLEATLREQLGGFDAYGETFAAHVEAWVTYHDHCSDCTPHDPTMDYELLDGPAPALGHYTEYGYDYDLIDAVEEAPHMVSTLVRLAAERRGIDAEVVREALSVPTALSDGAL